MAEPTNFRYRAAHAGLLEAAAHARALAEVLVGLPIEEARVRAAQDGQVLLRETAASGQYVTADFRADRITLVVNDGTVVEARGGS